MAANRIIRNRRKENSEVISGVHVSCADAPTLFRPLFGHESSTHGPLAADANARKQAQNSKLPNVDDERAEKRENGIPHDRQHEGPNTPEFVADRPP